MAIAHGHFVSCLRLSAGLARTRSRSPGRGLELIFIFISIPFALGAVLVSWYNFGYRLYGLKRIVFLPATLKAYVVVFFVWWIVRNLLHI